MSKQEELSEKQLEKVVGGLKVFRPKETLAQGMKELTPDQGGTDGGGAGQTDEDLNDGGVVEI